MATRTVVLKRSTRPDSGLEGKGNTRTSSQPIVGDSHPPPPPPPPPPMQNTAMVSMECITSSNYPARACASKGLCDRSWCLLYYIYYYILLYICKDFFYLSKYSLSDAHFSTGRLLFEFNRLQYTLAAPEVFVSSANPVILPSGYRVSIVRNTNIDQIETTPLRYCMLHG